MSDSLNTVDLDLGQWVSQFADGRAGLRETLTAHLEYVQAADAEIQAFAALDPAALETRIAELESLKASVQPLPPLYGLPVAVKDIVDTTDFPTAYGSPIFAGRYPISDATVIRRLRGAGAVILGKSVTTEFATFHPGPTRNPHRLTHTPGGSSSGSAAAVAAGMVPVAIGSQTNGSIVRPASFCGVYGFKPSFGLIPRTGVFDQSPSLDQLGVFAKNLNDLAKVADVLAGDDGHDSASRGISSYQFSLVMNQEPVVTPRFCFVKTPWWDQVSPDAQEAFEAFLELMDGVVELVALPDVVRQAVGWHADVNETELALALSREYAHHREGLSPALLARLEKAGNIRAVDYLRAKGRIPHVASAFDEYFDRYDAILAPAALGAAPEGLGSTGTPIMSTVWTFGGLPTVSLPLLVNEQGMPLGVQAIGEFRQDGRLLRSLRWFIQEFESRSQS